MEGAAVFYSDIPASSTKFLPRILDVSKHRSKNSPSLTWRECIKKIWKEDPLICAGCQNEMRIISFITEMTPIEKILK